MGVANEDRDHPDTPEPAASAARPDQMGGFAKGLAVIEAFGRGRKAMTIAELARETGLDRAVVRRCLLTLVNGGYAIDDGRYFELTPRILRLGHSYLSAPLPVLIQPSLDKLANRIGESCSAAVLDGGDVVYIARASHQRLMGAGLHPGSRLPAYCTSMGRVLLAALPPAQCRKILDSSNRQAFTDHTLTSVPDLTRAIRTSGEDGFSLIDQELEINSRSIAVPIRNISGATVAAINVAAHVSRASIPRLLDQVLPAMRDCQEQLARILP